MNNSYQDLLTDEEIKILLEHYNEINDIYELRVGNLVRYYKLINNNNNIIKKFRLGGNVIKIDYEKNYLILSNGTISWSIQYNNVIIYKKLTFDELKEFYENEIDEKDIIINKYKKHILEIRNKYNNLVDKYNKLKK